MMTKIDPYFINPPEPSCNTCIYRRYIELEKSHQCLNVNSHLYAEEVLPGDWCEKYERKGTAE